MNLTRPGPPAGHPAAATDLEPVLSALGLDGPPGPGWVPDEGTAAPAS